VCFSPLYAKLPGNQQKKEVIFVEGAPHIGPYFYDKEMYMKKIKDCIFS
jgi:hypothetical protein